MPQNAPSIHNRLHGIPKRILFCTTLTIIAATPSIFDAIGTFDSGLDPRVTILVVALYAAFWSTIACLPIINKLLPLPFVRRTLRITFIARLLFTLIFPLSFMFEVWLRFEIRHFVRTLMPSGFISHGAGWHVDFLPTLTIALLNGAVHSLLVIIFMTAIWSCQLIAHKRSHQWNGFSVEPVEPAKDNTK